MLNLKRNFRILLSCFIPFKELRHNIKNGKTSNICGVNNNIMLICNEGARPATLKELANLNIFIQGDNNTLYIPNNAIGYKITVFGSDNSIYCKSTKDVNFNIIFGDAITSINNSTCTIEEGVSSNGCTIFQYENNSMVNIGKNTMISFGVELWATDSHSIFSLENPQKPINIGKEISIGEHVWICKGVTILKNTKIANSSIIGCNATVSGKFNLENCIIAGNPAQVVKKNIFWDGKRVNDFITE